MNNFNLESYKNSYPDSIISKVNNVEAAEHLIEWLLNSLRNDPTAYYNELNTFQSYISPVAWCKYAAAMLENHDIYSAELSEKIANDITKLVTNIHGKQEIKTVFAAFEHYLACRIQPECYGKVLETTAKQAFERTGDNRYKLFVDFADMYFSRNIYTHHENIKELTGYFELSQMPETRRTIIYLIVLATQRLCILSEASVIGEYLLSQKYNASIKVSRLNSDDWIPYDDEYYEDYTADDDPTMFVSSYRGNGINIPRIIVEYNCPEIISIFDPNYHFYDGNFLRRIQAAAQTAIDNNKYSTEKEPIISQNLSFCRNILSSP